MLEEIDESKVDWSKVDKKAYDIVEQRFHSYRHVAEFYHKQGLTDKCTKFLDKAERLNQFKQLILKGKKIDMLKVEPELTPAVVLGYDEKTRVELFSGIIN